MHPILDCEECRQYLIDRIKSYPNRDGVERIYNYCRHYNKYYLCENEKRGTKTFIHTKKNLFVYDHNTNILKLFTLKDSMVQHGKMFLWAMAITFVILVLCFILGITFPM